LKRDKILTMSLCARERKEPSPVNSLYLQNRVALVTGASRGIGKATALELAKAGASLALVSRSADSLETVGAQVRNYGVKCISSAFDVSAEDALESFISRISEELGSVDILVNNAGIYETAALVDQSLDAWRRVLEINLTAAMRASKSVLPLMLQKKWGRIISISSISGKTGEPYGSSYSASKFALIGMSQSLALEVAPFGITVNAVCPGWVDTDMAQNQLHDEQWCRLNKISVNQSLEIAKLSVPQNRLIEPEEVAGLVAYLCTEQARAITGQAINICGGLSLH
jgi:3-hydroxybutyrate dehydrogenase